MASPEALQIRTLKALEGLDAKLDAIVGGEPLRGETLAQDGPTLADVARALDELKTAIAGLSAVVAELVAKVEAPAAGKAAKGKAA